MRGSTNRTRSQAMNDAPLPEPLEQFLQTPPQAPLNVELQASMFAQSAALLPARRHRRPWLIASAVAASIAGAFVTGYLVGRIQDAPVSTLPRQEFVEGQAQPAARKPDEQAPPTASVKTVTALEAESRAFDADDARERARLYY